MEETESGDPHSWHCTCKKCSQSRVPINPTQSHTHHLPKPSYGSCTGIVEYNPQGRCQHGYQSGCTYCTS